MITDLLTPLQLQTFFLKKVCIGDDPQFVKFRSFFFLMASRRGFCQINGRVITSTRRRKMIYLMGFISASFANDKLEGGWKNTIGF